MKSSISLVVAAALFCCGLSFKNELLDKRAFDKDKCPQPIDIAILLDSSNSISKNDWGIVKEFAKKIVDELDDVSKDGSHVAVIRYSDEAVIDLNFNTFGDDVTADKIKKKIDKLPQIKSSTFMDKALLLASEEVFTKDAGMREEKEIHKIVVILTDGMQTISKGSYIPLLDAAQPLKDKNVQIFVVGVGLDISLQQLVDMSSSPDNVYSAHGFDSLMKKLTEIRLQTCSCYRPLDFGVILDCSYSVKKGGFQKAIGAIKNLVNQVGIGPGDEKSHFGLLLYSKEKEIYVKYYFNDTQTVGEIEKALDKIKYDDVKGGATYTSAALEKAGIFFFDPNTLGNRPDVADVALLFTDGNSHDGTKGANKPYIKDTNTIVIGIGSELNKKQLQEFAHGKMDNVIQVDNFDKLDKEIDKIVDLAC